MVLWHNHLPDGIPASLRMAAHYDGTMSNTRQLLHLFNEWRGSYGADGRALVCDGPIGGDAAWETSPLRILFLLKEPHDRNSILEKCGYDLTELFRRPELYVGNRKSAERVLGRWAYCLQQIHAGNSYSLELAGRYAHSALLASAVINLKKLPGGKSSTDAVIRSFAGRDKDLLRREFDILQPDVVVCGGTYRTACVVFPELKPLAPGCAWLQSASCVWISHVHPSCRETNTIKYDKLFAAYRSSLSD